MIIYQYIEKEDFSFLSPTERKALEASNLLESEALLSYFPYRYNQRSAIEPLSNLAGAAYTGSFKGKIVRFGLEGFARNKRLKAILSDGYGNLELVWFRSLGYWSKVLGSTKELIVFGQAKQFRNSYSIVHPEIIPPKEESQIDGVLPEYSTNKHLTKAKISSRRLQSIVLGIKDCVRAVSLIPNAEKAPLALHQAIEQVHAPTDLSSLSQARDLIKLNEFFNFQLMLRYGRSSEKATKKPYRLRPKYHSDLTKALPFDLTADQEQALADIDKDLSSSKVMNRLIQGDVGSGKTVVAFFAMLRAVDEGKCACMMAPTELLAEQHMQNFGRLCGHLPLRTAFLSGSTKSAKRKQILTDLINGQIDLLFGTHALFQDEVEMQRLDLIVIDEQHRFGVEQRKRLALKGQQPHVLLLSATPIPRSLSMALYGDLDISLIKKKPAGRQIVRTAIRKESKREDIYRFFEQELAEGGRIYVIFPLVEESEKIDLKNAVDGFEQLRARFSNHACGLVHGKMKAEEKDTVMQAFKRGDIQILVSTTVIEVGVDVPEATVILIEHADRFGLSQLHQLRGRVGRGKRQSYCILMMDDQSGATSRKRLKILEQSDDGFLIAEEDLKIRGPGDLLGTKQSGLPEFRMADIVEDVAIMERSKAMVSELLEVDPQLELAQHAHIKGWVEQLIADQQSNVGVG